MSVHAVHAGAERNVCNIRVSTETPQTTTNLSQTLLPVYKLAHLPLPHPISSPPRPPQPLAQPFAQMRYRCKYQVSSTGPNILEVYSIYLHGDMCQYMRFCHISHVPRLRLACALLKFTRTCTDMVYSNTLERGVTAITMTKAILRLKTLAFIPS